MWKTIVNVFFVSVLGMLLGSRIATPLLFGVAVLALGLQVEAFWFLACVLGVWWFENWIVDASKMRNFFVSIFCFYQFQPAPFVGVA